MSAAADARRRFLRRYVTWRDHAPAEERAFDAYARAYCVRAAGMFCAAFLAVLPVYYLVDRAALGDGAALRDSARWRLGVGATLALGVVGAWWMRRTGRDAAAYPLGLLGGVAMCAIIGFSTAASAPFGSVTASAFLMLPLCAIPVVSRLWFRALATVLPAAAVLGAYYGAAPANAAHPNAWHFTALMVFACALSVAIGHALSHMIRQAYFLARRLAEDARALDARVREGTREVRELLAYVVEAREDERGRIAREVHDELGQLLGGAALALDRAQSLGEAPEAAEEAARARALVGQAMDAARTVVTELRPRLLDDMDLGAAVEWLLRRHEELTGAECDWSIEVDVARIPAAHATALFRVLQEALTNSAKHAAARSVSVVLEGGAGSLALDVRDDGVGFAPGVAGPRAFGLRGMAERARALGGEVTVESAPGEGARVRLTLPWNEGAK